MVIATGVVTTIGGPAPGLTTPGDTDGTGNASRFNSPYGVTTDGTHVFVADTANNKIRKMVIATLLVTTIGGPAQGTTTSGDADAAGNAARFSSPTGLTCDGTDLFIADFSNNKIRRLVLTSGVVTTIGGPAPGTTTGGDSDGSGNTSRFAQPQGITTDGAALQIADPNNHKIRKIR